MSQLPLNGRNFEQLAFASARCPDDKTGLHNRWRRWRNIFRILRTIGHLLGCRIAGLLDKSSCSTTRICRATGKRERVRRSPAIRWASTAIQEFQLLTNTYSAQFGGTGAAMNAVSKSGTNGFHGSAYEYLRNSALDARNFFDGTKIPPFRRNQFGGEPRRGRSRRTRPSFS